MNCTNTTEVTVQADKIMVNSTRLAKVSLLSLALIITGCATSNDVAEPSTNAAGTVSGVATDAATVPDKGDAKIDAKTAAVNAEYARLMALPNAYKDNAAALPAGVTEQVQSAQQTLNNGAIEQCIAQLQAIAQQYPQLSGVIVKLADVTLAQGNTALASAYYKQAIAANNNNYYAHNRLGSLQRKNGDFVAAQASYEAAIASWGAFAPAHLNLGILLDIYMGDKQQALASYQVYQVLTHAENRKVKGWIADLSMQLQRQQAKQGATNGE